MSKKEKICIVTGVGPDKGTGAEIAKLFGKKKYKVAMICLLYTSDAADE